MYLYLRIKTTLDVSLVHIKYLKKNAIIAAAGKVCTYKYLHNILNSLCKLTTCIFTGSTLSLMRWFNKQKIILIAFSFIYMVSLENDKIWILSVIEFFSRFF